VSRGLPYLAGKDDRGVETNDVVTALHHELPPLPLDVLFELDAEWPVVPGTARAAIDLSGGKDESSALGEGNDRIKRRCGHNGFRKSPTGRLPAGG
jgi:hypothetical protein